MARQLATSVLLDLDGTLTDPFPGISACIIHALEQLNLPAPAPERLREWIGPPLLDSFRGYFQALGSGADEHRALEHYRARFSDLGLFENEVYPGIPEVLGRLQQAGLRLYLATAKPLVYAQRIVEYFGLDSYLQACHGSELDGTRSDKVELLQFIVAQERLDSAHCAMVGDRRHDMEAARYHGMQAIGVQWGYGCDRELLTAGAEILLARPEELADRLIG